jgi:hypothetical protein
MQLVITPIRQISQLILQTFVGLAPIKDEPKPKVYGDNMDERFTFF